jgi:XTP/dITP diphosphohydrolase
MNLCFATNNKHKLEEIQALVGSQFRIVSLEDIGCKEELAEDQDTLEGNSLQKAEYVFKKYGVPCFADDSGLEVEALGGAPGVYSARYAGPQRSHDDNMTLLIRNLEGKANRNAQFRAVITLLSKQGQQQFEGILKGTIQLARKGSGGFGYDPIFIPLGFSKTLAEMSMEEKNKISHRAMAVQKLVEFLGKE